MQESENRIEIVIRNMSCIIVLTFAFVLRVIRVTFQSQMFKGRDKFVNPSMSEKVKVKRIALVFF